MALHYVQFVRSKTIEEIVPKTVAHFYGWLDGELPAVGDQLVGVPRGPVAQLDFEGEQV